MLLISLLKWFFFLKLKIIYSYIVKKRIDREKKKRIDLNSCEILNSK